MMSIIDSGYNRLIRPLLFRLDPEHVHDLVMGNLRRARLFKPLLKPIFTLDDARFSQTFWGMPFINPIGLAGGFDKNAECTDVWDLFGFSFFEIGTVTPRPQPGNPKPRLFRYPEQEAIVNRMGFNNDGAEAISRRLEQAQQRDSRRALMGVSLGKQMDTPADDMARVIEDYTRVLEILHPYGDFFIVNVSSPNTKNLRDLQQKDRLDQLLAALLEKLARLGQSPNRKPLLVKLSPDLSQADLEAAVSVIDARGVDGIIATNTTNQIPGLETGGVSGKPLRARSTEVIRRIAEQTQGRIPLIGCGGIFSWEDALEKFQAGAQLLQIYTGFVYRGPTVVRNILAGLIRYLDEHGQQHIWDLNPYPNQRCREKD